MKLPIQIKILLSFLMLVLAFHANAETSWTKEAAIRLKELVKKNNLNKANGDVSQNEYIFFTTAQAEKDYLLANQNGEKLKGDIIKELPELKKKLSDLHLLKKKELYIGINGDLFGVNKDNSSLSKFYENQKKALGNAATKIYGGAGLKDAGNAGEIAFVLITPITVLKGSEETPEVTAQKISLAHHLGDHYNYVFFKESIIKAKSDLSIPLIRDASIAVTVDRAAQVFSLAMIGYIGAGDICEDGKKFVDENSVAGMSDAESASLVNVAKLICKFPESDLIKAFFAENQAKFSKMVNSWWLWDSEKNALNKAKDDFWKRTDAWQVYFKQLERYVVLYNQLKVQIESGAVTNSHLKALVNARTDEFLDLYTLDERIEIITSLLPEDDKVMMEGGGVNYAELMVSDGEEHAILKVLKSVSSQADAEKMLDEISTNGFLKKLNFHLDDIGFGGDNYSELSKQFRKLALLKNGVQGEPNLSYWTSVIPESYHFVYNDKRVFSFGVPVEKGGVHYKTVEYNDDAKMSIVLEVCGEIENYDMTWYNKGGIATTVTNQRCKVVLPEETYEPNYFDLISIDVIDLSYLPQSKTELTSGSAFITYAGFLDYILEKKGTQQVIDITDYTVTAVTLAFGIGEVALLIRGGATTARIALASYDIGIEIADLVINSESFASHICGEGISTCPELTKWKVGNTLAQITAIGASGYDIANNWSALKSSRNLGDEVLDHIKNKLSVEEFRRFNADFGKNPSALAKFKDNDALVDSWSDLHDLNPNSFIKTDIGRLEVFHKLSTDNKNLIKQFTDVDTNSTLAKFLDDCDADQDFLSFINSSDNTLEVKGFLAHKEGVLTADENRLLSEMLNNSDEIPNEKVRKWLEYGDRQAAFKANREAGNAFGDLMKDQLGDVSSEAYTALKQKISNLDDYSIYSQVQLCLKGDCQSAGNYWIPDFMLVVEKTGPNGKYLETIIVDAKLSGTTGWTKNQGVAIGMSDWNIKSINSESLIKGVAVEGFDVSEKIVRDGSFIKLFNEGGVLKTN